MKSFLSWPKNESWRLCFVNRSDWTNMPPDPQHGSKTTPFSGSSIATSVLTIETGVNYSPPRFPSLDANSPMNNS